MTDILFNVLKDLLLGRLGVIIAITAMAGLGLISLYFLNSNFRRAYNLFMGPSGPQARYGKNGVAKAGYAFDEESNRWRYVQKSSYYRKKSGNSYGYSKYRREFEE